MKGAVLPSLVGQELLGGVLLGPPEHRLEDKYTKMTRDILVLKEYHLIKQEKSDT